MANKNYGVPDKQMLKEYCNKCEYRYFSADDLCCKDCCYNPIGEYRWATNKQAPNTPKIKENNRKINDKTV